MKKIAKFFASVKKEMITYSIATLVFMAILGLFFIATDLIIAGVGMVFI